MTGVAMLDHVSLSLKRFILIEACPDDWMDLDLYLFRDRETVFYVGQSFLAFHRVWDHIRNGYKARSDAGRFLLCNWPKSMNFEIEFWSATSPAFAGIGHQRTLAEEWLIQRHRPCFNASGNAAPTPLPDVYLPPETPIRCSRRLKQLQYQAFLSVRNDEKEKWVEA